MTIHNVVPAYINPIFVMEANTFDVVLVYGACTTIILPSLGNSTLGSEITIVNIGGNNVKIVNQVINIDFIKPNTNITYLKSIDNVTYWVKINFGTNTDAGIISWTQNGNATTGNLGTTTTNTWNLIYNGNTIATIGPSTITGLPLPNNTSDVAIKGYVDTSSTNAINTAVTTAVATAAANAATNNWSNTGNNFSGAKLGTTNGNTWNIIYNGNTIATVGNTISTGVAPSSSNDITNKNYVDQKKNLSGVVPLLEGNTSNTGFNITVSSFFPGYQGYNAFTNTSSEWASGGPSTPFWIQVQFPFPAYPWNITLTGRVSSPIDQIGSWSLLGSNDNFNFVTIPTPTSTALTTFPQQFPVTYQPNTFYTIFRLNCTSVISGATLLPGLAKFQLFCYNN